MAMIFGELFVGFVVITICIVFVSVFVLLGFVVEGGFWLAVVIRRRE